VMALDAGGVYVWEAPTGSIVRVSLAGGPTTTLATSQLGVGGLAVDQTILYWTNSSSGTVVSMPEAGGAVSIVASGQPEPSLLLTDGVWVAWTNFNGGPGAESLANISILGSNPFTIASNQGGIYALAVASTGLFWSTDQGIFGTDHL
jgi:hypothetical protein